MILPTKVYRVVTHSAFPATKTFNNFDYALAYLEKSRRLAPLAQMFVSDLAWKEMAHRVDNDPQLPLDYT